MTPEQLEQAKQMASDGATYADIAEEFGIPKEDVARLLSADGVHRELLRQKRNTIYEMYRAGKGAKEISEAVGLTVSSVKNIITKQRRFAPY